jgi:hypothetical protein
MIIYCPTGQSIARIYRINGTYYIGFPKDVQPPPFAQLQAAAAQPMTENDNGAKPAAGSAAEHQQESPSLKNQAPDTGMLVTGVPSDGEDAIPAPAAANTCHPHSPAAANTGSQRSAAAAANTGPPRLPATASATNLSWF